MQEMWKEAYADMKYRNHPQILDLYSRTMYRGLMKAATQNNKLERVGNA
jgi:superfamily I DNA and/or RNA helicase